MRHKVLLFSAIQCRRAEFSLIEIAAITFAIFLIFAPGFGLQYLMYITPIMAIISLSVSILYSLIAGAFCLLTYLHFMTRYWPAESFHTPDFDPFAARIGALTWIILVGFLFRLVSTRHLQNKA